MNLQNTLNGIDRSEAGIRIDSPITSADGPPRVGKRRIAIYAALFFSGASALVLELVFSRLLQRVFGVSDLAVATVLAAYFLGLGLGSRLGAAVASRIEDKPRAYAGIEAGIALLALASLLLVPLIGRMHAGVSLDTPFFTLTLIRFGAALVVLLPPTVLMGATLPVLIAATPRAGWVRHAGMLYGINTLGAVAGVAAAGLWLLPILGARLLVLVAVVLNLTAGGIVLLAFRHAPDSREEAIAPAPELPSGGRPSFAAWLAFASGALALVGEVVWTRVLRLVVQGTTQAFAAMLVCTLSGITLGAFVASRFAHSPRAAAQRLGYAQVALALFSAAGLATANSLPQLLGRLSPVHALEAATPSAILIVACLVLLPISFASGTIVPFAWQVAGSREDVGESAGRVLAANTVGGLLGAILAGFVLLPSLGLNVTVLTVVFVHLAVAAVALRAGADASLLGRVGSLVGPPTLGLLILLARPSVDLAYLAGAQAHPAEVVAHGREEFYAAQTVRMWEGRNSTVTVTREGDSLRLFNDGRPESGFGRGDPGFGPELAMLGILPTTFAPTHERALMVGLGAGHSVGVLLSAPWRRVDVVELEPGIVEASKFLYDARQLPWPLRDPRAHLVVDDARAVLVRSSAHTYDAIVSQPSHPWLAGSSALYTQEFFAEVNRALKRRGVFVLWINLFRNDVRSVQSVVRTLRSAFGHVSAYMVEDSSMIFAASDAPLTLDENRASATTLSHFERHLRSGDATSALLMAQEFDDGASFAANAPLLADDRPTLEYALAQLSPNQAVTPSSIDGVLRGESWISNDAFGSLYALSRVVPAVRSRILNVMDRPAALSRVEHTLTALELPTAEHMELVGALAEARGQVDAALAAYDRAATPSSLFAADSLRLAEGAYSEMLTRASARAVLPESAVPLLRAALSTGDLVQAEVAVGIARARHVPEDGTLLRLVEAHTQGCDVFMSAPEHARVSGMIEVAEATARCEATTGEPARIARAEAILRETKSRLATVLYEAAERAYRGGNVLPATRLLLRVLRVVPAHPEATVLLSRCRAALVH